MIDDGRRGGQNAASAVAETIRCIGADFVPHTAAAVRQQVQQPWQEMGLDVDWLEMFIGTDDLPDAFRGCPLAEEDQRASVVAVWSPEAEGWRYVLMHGCPFGLGSVVLTFNRYPALVVAATRRVLCLLHGAYFDDNLLLDFEPSAPAAQGLLTTTFTTLGTPPKVSKKFPMSQYRPFLGTSMEVAAAMPYGTVMVKPRDHSRQAVVEDLQDALDARRLTPGQASKLRGRSGWVATNTFGKIGRMGTALLKHLQYGHRDSPHLLPSQINQLQFHLQVVKRVRGRAVNLTGTEEKPVVAYTDAEYSPSKLPRIGGIIFTPSGTTPTGFTALIPATHSAYWKERTQQIFLAELSAVPILLARYHR